MRTRHVRPLSAAEQAELTRMHRRGATDRERRRAHLILLSAVGHCLKRAGELAGLERQAASRAVERFEAGGTAGLQEPKRPGRTPRLDAAAREDLGKALRRSPREFGYATNTWTGRLACDYVQKQDGVTLSDDQMWRIFRALGFRQVKARRRLQKGDA